MGQQLQPERHALIDSINGGNHDPPLLEHQLDRGDRDSRRMPQRAVVGRPDMGEVMIGFVLFIAAVINIVILVIIVRCALVTTQAAERSDRWLWSPSGLWGKFTIFGGIMLKKNSSQRGHQGCQRRWRRSPGPSSWPGCVLRGPPRAHVTICPARPDGCSAHCGSATGRCSATRQERRLAGCAPHQLMSLGTHRQASCRGCHHHSRPGSGRHADRWPWSSSEGCGERSDWRGTP